MNYCKNLSDSSIGLLIQLSCADDKKIPHFEKPILLKLSTFEIVTSVHFQVLYNPQLHTSSKFFYLQKMLTHSRQNFPFCTR